jgi:lipid A 4'-phosphatase
MSAAERVVWGLLALLTGIALIPVGWPQLDLMTSALFLRPDPWLSTATWWWVRLINEYTPALFRSLALLSVLTWLWLSRRQSRQPALRAWTARVAFFALALWAGPGFLVSASKEVTLRARPAQVQEFGGPWTFSPALQHGGQCDDDNCAFPSGHVSDGFFLASLALIFPRRRWFWGLLGLAAGLAVGFARVSVGAHWLSDALWAAPITLISSLLVWRVMWRWDIAHLRTLYSGAK